MKKTKTMKWLSHKKVRPGILFFTSIYSFLLFFAVSQAWASETNQKQITLKMENASIKEILDELAVKCDKLFFYSDSEIDLKKKITVDLENKTMEEILQFIQAKSGNFTYEITDNYVTIMPVLKNKSNEKVEMSVKGKVTDEDGNPLPGATVLIKGTTKGTITDVNGNYVIRVPESSVLVFSFVGFEAQQILVEGQTEQKIVNVKMKESKTELGEVVVTGYLDIPEVKSTGSVSKISTAEIRKSGAISIDQVFRGTMPGVLALNLSGRPGATSQIRIRGLNSITGNMEPIWIIDGMEMKESVPNIFVGGVALQNSILTNGIGSINPSDIESITVLKDAAASALYGARAANGVIVVKTKNGTAGDNRINISSSFSISEAPTNHYDMMNTAEKIQYERDINEENKQIECQGRVNKILWDVLYGRISEVEGEAKITDLSKIETDWFDVIFRPAFSWRHSINVSGGSQKVQYYVSTALNKEKGILKRNELKIFNSLAKLTVLPVSKLKIESQIRASVRKDIAPDPVENPFRYAVFANPYEKPYNDDGTYAYDRTYQFQRSIIDGSYVYDFNILEDMATATSKNNSSSITVDGRISYDVLKNLNLESQVQYTYSSSYGRSWAEPGSYASYKRSVLRSSGLVYLPDELNNGYLRETHGHSESYTFKNLVKYNANIKDVHFVNILLGQEASQTDAGNFYSFLPEYDPLFQIGGYNTEIDPNAYDDLSNTEVTLDTYNLEMLGNTGLSESRSASFFMNASYSYKDIYVFSGSVRYDGVDIIGNKNNFTPLWNLSGKWNLHREKFMQNIDFVDVLSLRGSFGYTGSIDRNSLPFTYMTFQSILYYDGAMMPTDVNWRNPNVKWQKKLDRNIGLNASLFKNKFNIELNYYNNKVTDLLDDKQLPISTGISTIRANVASVTNSGFELDLNTVVLNTSDWRWTLSFNLSKNSNKITETFYKNILELPVIEQGDMLSGYFESKYYTIGYDVSAIFGYEFAGVDPQTGNTLAYVNNEEYLNEWEVHSEKDGRKIIDMDRNFNHEATLTYLGKTQPSISGGFGTTLSYKAFTLSAQFTYVRGNLIRSPSTTRIIDSRLNLLRNTANRWRQPGDITDIPEIVMRSGSSTSAYTSYFFDSYMEKGDFLKLAYVNLSYNLPGNFIKKLGMQRCRLSIIANNVFTWTKYRGMDPENNGAFGYPSARKYTASLEITF